MRARLLAVGLGLVSIVLVAPGCEGPLAVESEEPLQGDYPMQDADRAPVEQSEPRVAVDVDGARSTAPDPSEGEEPAEVAEAPQPPESEEVSPVSSDEPVLGAHGLCPDFTAFGETVSCCEDTGSCVPMDALPPGLQSQVSTCEDGAACVPKAIITSIVEEGGFWPRVCTSIGSAAGVCLSTCIPKVGQFASLLPQDTCEANERCTPCIDPFTGQDSGACGDGLDCFPDADGVPSAEEEAPPVEEALEPPTEAYSCENPPTEPVVDPESFPACGVEAHCVPSAAVEEVLQDNLAECDGGFCVPDPMIASAGFFVSELCTSLNGVEGRCMNTVLPEVGELADSLPIDVCAAHERCSPCCHPMTGLSSGTCDQGCDLGPEEGCTGESEYVSCCGGTGHCIGAELIPDALEGSLAKCKGEAAGNLCVPDAMQSLDYEGESCQGNSLILGQYEGVCLPQCLKIFLKISFDKSPCAAGHMCVPCADPLTGGTTDAPGCQP
jgi:hypothetical protein